MEREALDRIATNFETELSAAVGRVLAQPDEDLKMDLLHVKMSISNHSIYFYNLQGLLYQLKILRQEVTANCHATIFSMVTDNM